MDSSNNNSFGGAGVPVISSSPSDGPVFVGGGTSEKKTKKWILIVGALLGVFVLVGVLVYFLVGNQKAKNDGDLKSYVNEYINLLATGKKDEVLEGDFNFSTISSDERANIYTIPRFYGVLSEENTGYYGDLQDLLNKIKGKIKNVGYSEDTESELEFLVDDSKTMLSYYFTAAALAYTNSDYNYYFKNKTLDGLFLVYGYPFGEVDDMTMLNFKNNIDELYQSKIKFYESVYKTDCMLDDGINYACLGDLNSAQINEIQEQDSWLTSVEEQQTDQILQFVIADAEDIGSMVNGGKK